MFQEQLPFLENISPQFREILLRILLTILALLIIWLLRRVLTWILLRPLRALARRTNRIFDDQLIDAMIPPSNLLVIALGIHISALILGAEPEVLIFVRHLTRTLVIIAVFMVASRLVDIYAPSSNRLFAFTGLTIEDRLLPFARTATKLVLGAIALVIIIQEWGYDVSGLVAGLGIGGLAISLAAQDSLSNLFGFSAIVGDNPFNVGEFIKTPDVEGTVERVGIRSTRIRQPDQAHVTVPNSKLAQSAILNWSRLGKRWYNTTIGISYETNSTQLRELLECIREILRNREQVEKDSILVHMIDFGEFSIKILIRGYIMLPNWAEFTAEKEIIHLAVMDCITKLGLKLAFPSQSLYIEEVPRLFEGSSEPYLPPSTSKPADGSSVYRDMDDSHEED